MPETWADQFQYPAILDQLSKTKDVQFPDFWETGTNMFGQSFLKTT